MAYSLGIKKKKKINNMKTFVIGDVHGNNRALLQCLEKSGFDKENDKLISLGDIADGWSEVPQCVETLLSIKNLSKTLTLEYEMPTFLAISCPSSDLFNKTL